MLWLSGFCSYEPVFFWFIASEEVKFKIETASSILLSHQRKVKIPSHFSHWTKPTGTVIFWEAGCCLFSECEVLTCYPWAWNFPIKITCDSFNSMAFLLHTYLWHPSDASNLPEVSFTMVPFQKKLIVKDSKVIERLSFASKTVRSCVHLSQRRLRKFWGGILHGLFIWGSKFRKTKCWWHHLGFWCLFLFPMETSPKFFSPAGDRARSCSEANTNLT